MNIKIIKIYIHTKLIIFINFFNVKYFLQGRECSFSWHFHPSSFVQVFLLRIQFKHTSILFVNYLFIHDFLGKFDQHILVSCVWHLHLVFCFHLLNDQFKRLICLFFLRNLDIHQLYALISYALDLLFELN